MKTATTLTRRPLAAALALLGLMSMDPLHAAPAAVAGEVLVKFKAQVSDAAKAQKHASEGHRRLRAFRHARIDHVALRAGQSVDAALARYRADPNVEYAEPNYVVKATRLPSEPAFAQQWALFNNGQTGGLAGADIQAVPAWDLSTGSASVVVMVNDSGIDLSHPDLAPNLWTNTGEIPGNGLDDDNNGFIDDVHGADVLTGDGDPTDEFGHGTHAAGIIGAAGNNGAGVVGVNWTVKLAACRFLDAAGNGTAAGAIACLEYTRALKAAGHNVVATNNSWGEAGAASQALRDAIDAQRDILFVAPAGNGSANNDSTPFYPASFNLPNILSVTATDHNDLRLATSNVGRRSVHLGAPGSNILSTLPGGNFGAASGSSIAAPLVAGVAALAKAQDPSRDWRSLKNLILAGAAPNASLTGQTISGRRLDALGAMTCSNRPLLSALQLPASFAPAVPVTLSVLSINCGAAAGPVTVTPSVGAAFTLRDDGVAPDLAAGDGVFAGTWTPTGDTAYVDISSPAGTERVGTPDLAVPQFNVPASLVAGQPAAASLTVVNNGARDAAATSVNVRLSTSGFFSATDPVLATLAVPALAAGAQQVLNFSLVVPSAGSYWVRAVVDPANQVGESDEGNNASPARNISVAAATPPADLVVSALSGPTSAMRGRTITLSGTVRNAGLSPAGASTLGLRLSKDAVITTADTPLGTLAVPALAAGASVTFSVNVTVPSTLAKGTYYPGAIADVGNGVVEANEANNTRAGGRLSVR